MVGHRKHPTSTVMVNFAARPIQTRRKMMSVLNGFSMSIKSKHGNRLGGGLNLLLALVVVLVMLLLFLRMVAFVAGHHHL